MPVATQVATDTFAYSTGALPAPWVQTPSGVWQVDGPSQVAYPNGSAGNAVQDTGSSDHRVLINLKTGGSQPSTSGAILRYKDEQNYISFEYVWTSSESAWSLFIKANNVGREIKLNASPALAADQNHTLQIDAFGDEITVTLDSAVWGSSPYALTAEEATALGATATKAGMISFAGFGNFYDVTLYTLEEDAIMTIGDSYATLAELKARATSQITGTANDAAMTNALSVASRAIESYCRRQFNKTTTASAREFSPLGYGLAHVDDFHTTTDLVIKTDEDGDGVYETTWSSTDYRLEPLNGMRHGESGWPYWRIRTRPQGVRTFYEGVTLEVTAQWGWNAVPPAIKEACLALAEETFKLKDAPFGYAGGFADFGPVRVRDNPRVTAMLVPYRLKSVLVH